MSDLDFPPGLVKIIQYYSNFPLPCHQELLEKTRHVLEMLHEDKIYRVGCFVQNFSKEWVMMPRLVNNGL